MGEEKIVGNMENGASSSTEAASNSNTPQDINESSHEHHGEHSHHHRHHHHHSSSHHHRSGARYGSFNDKKKRKRRHSRIRRWFRKLKKTIKQMNNKKRITFVCALALAFIMMFSIGLDLVTTIMNAKAEKEANEREENGNYSDVLVVELINGEGILITDAVSRYLKVDLLAEYNKNVKLSNFVEGGKRYDAQKPVSLQLSTVGSVASMYKIEIADNAQFNNAQVEYFDCASGTFDFKHLYVNTKYHYRVTAYTNGGVVVETGSFTTADTPRILSIDGLTNVRDIGNWMTDSGKRIKQGLLIRGTEMDGAVESHYYLTYEGLDDMLNVYGIKFDMDLRSELATPLGSDALGSRVEHKYYDMVMYESIFTEEGRAKVKAVFTDLANPNNYPMYLHCTYGCDRTGTVCYLLEALLGVSRGDCLKEYGLSNMPIELILAVETGLAQYGANLTLREQVELYLSSCGVTVDQMNTIREIFLGE